MPNTENLRPKLVLTFWTDNSALPQKKEISTQAYCYPNPTPNWIYTTDDTIKSIELFSANGTPFLCVQANKCNISALPQGLYIVQLHFQDGSMKQQKLTKI